MKVYPVLAYVAAPYRDPRGPYYIRQNIRAAEEIAVALWRMGIPVYCPHKNTALLDGIVPDEVFLAGTREALRRCDLVVFAPGWQQSEGCRMEMAFAHQRRIPVFFWLYSHEREEVMEYVRRFEEGAAL